jgi:hypothetical protein
MRSSFSSSVILRLAALSAAALLAACGGSKHGCANTPCATGQYCDPATLICIAGSPDGSTLVRADSGLQAEPDAGDGDVDAGEVDAGEVDAGEVDAGEVDAGAVSDAGVVDAGWLAADAGPTDAGSPDAGAVDAGQVDLPPSLSLASDGGLLTQTQLSLTGRASDDHGLALVEATTDDGGTWRTVTPDGSGAFQLGLSVPALDGAPWAVVVRARDTAGQTTRAAVDFLVDNVPPTLSITAPAVGATLNASTSTVTVSGTTSGTHVAVTFAGTTVAALLTGTTWSATLPVPVEDATSEPLTVLATDAAGNHTQLMQALTVDTVAPVVSFISPQRGALLGGPSVATVTVTLDAPGAASVTMALGADLKSATHTTGSTWVATLALPIVDSVQETIDVTATDAAGNVTLTSRAIVVDRVAPTVTLQSPQTGASLGGPGVTSLAVLATAPGAQTVSMSFAGQTTLATQSSGWSATFALPSLDGVQQTVTVQATDAAGNVGQASVVVVVDTVGPTLTVTSPAAGAKLSQATLTPAGTVTGASAVTVALDGAAPSSATVNGSTFTASVALPTVDFSTHTLTVAAVDTLGNQTVQTVSVVVDRQAPTVSAFSPSTGSLLGQAALDASGHASVTLTAADADPSLSSQWSTDQSHWTDGATALVPTSATDNGASYTVYFTVTDSSGNVLHSSTTVKVDRVAPTASWSISTGTRNVTARVLTLTVSEPVTSSVPFTLTPAPSQPGSWAGALTYTSGALDSDTAYATTLLGTLQDAAGNPVTGTGPAFHTSVQTPADGVLATNVQAFDVLSDADGAVLLGLQDATSNQYRVVRLSTKTGALESSNVATISPGTVGYHAQLSASRTVAADLSAVREVGALLPNGASSLGYVSVAGAPASSFGGIGVLATSPISSADGAGSSGTIVGTSYLRGGSTVATLSNTPVTLVANNSRWDAFSFARGVSIDDFSCAKSPMLHCGIDTVTFADGKSGLASDLSAALSPNGSCLAVVYPSLSGRSLGWQPGRNALGALPAAATELLADAWFLAPSSVGGENALVAVWTSTALGTTTVHLMKSTSCAAGGFSEVGSVVPGLGAVTAPRPVQVGQALAVLYLDGSKQLRLKAF